MLPDAIAGTITATATLVSALAALVAAINSARNHVALKRVEKSVNGDLKRLSDHILEARRELSKAEELFGAEQRRVAARPKRAPAKRRPAARSQDA